MCFSAVSYYLIFIHIPFLEVILGPLESLPCSLHSSPTTRYSHCHFQFAFLETVMHFIMSVFLLKKNYLSIYLFGCTSCGMQDLVPWPGFEPEPLQWEHSLSHWTTREVLSVLLIHPKKHETSGGAPLLLSLSSKVMSTFLPSFSASLSLFFLICLHSGVWIVLGGDDRKNAGCPNHRPTWRWASRHLGRWCLSLVWPTQLSIQPESKPAQQEMLVGLWMLRVRVGADVPLKPGCQTTKSRWRCRPVCFPTGA